MQPPGDDSKYEFVEAVAHPPQLGGSAAEPAIVRRDQEIGTAVGHVGNLDGAPRPCRISVGGADHYRLRRGG